MRATGANVRSGEKQLNYGNKGVSDNYNPAVSVTDTAYILGGTSSSIIIRESDDQHVPASHNQFNPVGKDELGYRNKGDAGRATLNNSDPAATNFRSGEDNWVMRNVVKALSPTICGQQALIFVAVSHNSTTKIRVAATNN